MKNLTEQELLDTNGGHKGTAYFLGEMVGYAVKFNLAIFSLAFK